MVKRQGHGSLCHTDIFTKLRVRAIKVHTFSLVIPRRVLWSRAGWNIKITMVKLDHIDRLRIQLLGKYLPNMTKFCDWLSDTSVHGMIQMCTAEPWLAERTILTLHTGHSHSLSGSSSKMGLKQTIWYPFRHLSHTATSPRPLRRHILHF